LSADLLKRLADAGTPMDLIMEVAETLAEARAAERLLDRRREKDRIRKRNSKDSAEIVETAEIQDGVSLDKETPQTPKEIKPIPCVRETRARLGYHRLPEGWRPTRPFPAPLQAKVDQWPPGTLDDEIAAMKRWAANAEDKNGKGRKLDWDKALWNWLGRRHDEHFKRTNGLGRNQPSDGLSSTARAARDVFGVGASH
jgi:hypothetical protein